MSYDDQQSVNTALTGAGGAGSALEQPDDGSAGSEFAFAFVKQLAMELSSNKLDLPSLPGVVTRIKSVLEDEDSTADTISRVVGSEPAVAARLLAIANSAAYSRGGIEVTDLKSAVGRLGRDTIRTSAMSFAMKNLMDAQSVTQLKPELTALWKHSITVAAMANAIGKRVRGVNADEAMFIGLVHDIGKLYILSRIGSHPELFRCPEAVAEIMSDWHTEIGKAIVESWDFPEYVAQAVSDHEDLERQHNSEPDVLDVLIAANVLVNAQENDTIDDFDFESVSAFTRLKIDANRLLELTTESKEELDTLMSALRG